MPRKKVKLNLSELSFVREGAVLVRGKRIKARRAELNWTQLDLQLKSGLSKSTISDAEAGGPCFPNSVHCLAIALGLTYDDLALMPRPAQKRKSRSGAKSELTEVGLVLSGSAENQSPATSLKLLIQRLTKIIGANSPLIVTRIDGSNEMVLKMAISKIDVSLVVEAFADRKLDELQVSSLILRDPSMFEQSIADADAGGSVFYEIYVPTFREEGRVIKTLTELSLRSPRTVTLTLINEQEVVLTRC